jgi:hypothetical protein
VSFLSDFCKTFEGIVTAEENLEAESGMMLLERECSSHLIVVVDELHWGRLGVSTGFFRADIDGLGEYLPPHNLEMVSRIENIQSGWGTSEGGLTN